MLQKMPCILCNVKLFLRNFLRENGNFSLHFCIKKKLLSHFDAQHKRKARSSRDVLASWLLRECVPVRLELCVPGVMRNS